MSGTSAGELLEQLQSRELPRHVAVIMDGNGRWAADRGLPRWRGHREGMRAVRRTVEAALELGIEYLTLYAFSIENWSRPEQEVGALMRLLNEFVEREMDELRAQGVRARVFGDRERLPPAAQSSVETLESTTAGGTKLNLNLAISYGSRDEIAAAARRLAELAADGELDPTGIDADRLAAELYTAGWPDPDLLIRTSGEMRVSNFLLWQIAYAEIHVTPVLWPDFGRDEMFAAVANYQGRQRRFGGVTS
ncbi:MAG: isoprenyl transferase [Gemmatimonadota bacterium]